MSRIPGAKRDSCTIVSPPQEFDETWRLEYDELPVRNSGFCGWRATLLRQIVDLREMQENAMLSNKYLDFGVDAPRGGRWYNFDPQSYLDCAVAGSLGGWEPGDLSGGQFLPGQVIVIEDNGTIGEANSEDISLPVFEIARLSWNEFRDFLNCGQFYE